MAITKIKDSDYSNKGIRVKNNPLGLSVSEAQRAFDELTLDVVIPAINRMADEMDTTVSGLQNNDTKNKDAINKNTSDIELNKNDIAKIKTDISQNATDIAKNKTNISQNATDITELKQRVSTAEGNISTDKTDIKDIKEKVSVLQDKVSEKAETDNVLLKDNTEAFVPTDDYNPATKKYVDDLVSDAGGGDMLKTVYDKQNRGIDIYTYADSKVRKINLTINVSDWVSATTERYSYRCDIDNSNIVATDIPMATVALASLDIAKAATLAEVCEAGNGYIRFYCEKIPTSNITVQVVLFNATLNVTGTDTSNYKLPTASNDRLGGVKIGIDK